MRKIVVNVHRGGGFSLSAKAVEMYESRTAHGPLHSSAFFVTGESDEIARDDVALVEVVEQLGAAANGACAKLEIVEIPREVDFVIEAHDGVEHVAERHRKWFPGYMRLSLTSHKF